MNKKILSLSAAMFSSLLMLAQAPVQPPVQGEQTQQPQQPEQNNNLFEGTFSLRIESSKKEKPVIDENFFVKRERTFVEVINSKMPDKKSDMILNSADKSTIMLVDNKDHKMAMKMRPPGGNGPGPQQMPGRPGQPNMKKPEIMETGETKIIDGYKCKKVVVKSETSNAEVWYTTEVPLNFAELSNSMGMAMTQPRPGIAPNEMTRQPNIPVELKGFPMLIISNNMKTGEVTTMTFKNVKKGQVDEKKFDTKGYQQMDMPMMPPPPMGAPGGDDR